MAVMTIASFIMFSGRVLLSIMVVMSATLTTCLGALAPRWLARR